MACRLGAGSDAWGIWHAAHPAQMPWERYLDEVAAAGLRYVEPGPHGYLPTDNAQLADALQSRGLAMPAGTFFARISGSDLDAIRRSADETAAWLAAAGAGFFIFLDDFYRDPDTGEMLADRRLSGAQWSRMIGDLNALARHIAEGHGLRFVYHPHCDAQVEDEADIAKLLEDTDPALVGLCLDTGHHAYCGGDPAAFMRAHAARIPYLHLKSMDAKVLSRVRAQDMPWGEAVVQGVTATPDAGIVDFSDFAAALRETGYDGFGMIEQDQFPADFDCCLPNVLKSIAFYESLGFER